MARLSEKPAEARPLIDLLVEQRLLSTDMAVDTKEVTVEPAHEALLRKRMPAPARIWRSRGSGW